MIATVRPFLRASALDDVLMGRSHEIADWTEENYVKVGSTANQLADVVKAGCAEILGASTEALVSVRVKTPSSLAKKLCAHSDGVLKYGQADTSGADLITEHVHDVIGVRIIVPLDRHVRQLKQRWTGSLDGMPFVEELDIHKSQYDLTEARRPGYRSLHGVLNIEKNWPSPVNTVEIQIRTVLQHAWAQLSHDLLYKGEALDWSVERRLHALAGMLELADAEFGSTEYAAALGEEHAGLERKQVDVENLNVLSRVLLGDSERAEESAWLEVLTEKLRHHANIGTVVERIGLESIAQLRVQLQAATKAHPWVPRTVLVDLALHSDPIELEVEDWLREPVPNK
jgi:ppGpp synthetase/RelA/SpoT-type nucleotidyltranferase